MTTVNEMERGMAPAALALVLANYHLHQGPLLYEEALLSLTLCDHAGLLPSDREDLLHADTP